MLSDQTEIKQMGHMSLQMAERASTKMGRSRSTCLPIPKQHPGQENVRELTKSKGLQN